MPAVFALPFLGFIAILKKRLHSHYGLGSYRWLPTFKECPQFQFIEAQNLTHSLFRIIENHRIGKESVRLRFSSGKSAMLLLGPARYFVCQFKPSVTHIH